MAHEEDLCTEVLSLALKQTKAGPWTPFSSVLRMDLPVHNTNVVRMYLSYVLCV